MIARSLACVFSLLALPTLAQTAQPATAGWTADARTGSLFAQGKDKQGGARFAATTTFRVADHPAGSGAVISTHGQVEISGRLASVIEGGAGIVVKRMSAEFARCLSARTCAQS